MIDIPETLAARGLKLILWSPAVRRDDSRNRDVASPDLYLDGKWIPFQPIEVIAESRHEAEDGFLKAFEKQWPNAKGTVYWRQPDQISRVFPKISEAPPGTWRAYGLCVVVA